MGRFNWGPEGPPEDAYSRVTEPERFMPLHAWALEAVALLNTSYEVALEEGIGMDAELERRPLSRPTLKVAPLQDSCAPITIAFTDFPGLAVRACLRSLGYVKLRLLPRQGNHVSFLSQRHQPGAIRPDSSHAGIGPPTDQAPHRGPVRRFLRRALLAEERLPVADAPGGLPGLAHLLQVFPAME